MDEEELEKEQAKQEAGEKTAHVAGKAAATYLGGGAGGKIYDAASNTAVGQKLEEAAGKVVQKVPLVNNTSEKLNESGLLDVADKGLDIVGKKMDSNINTSNNSQASNNEPLVENNDQTTSNEGIGLVNEESETEDVTTRSPLKKPIKVALISVAVCFLLIFMVIAGVAGAIYYPFEAAANHIKGAWDTVVDWFTTDQIELENEYYDELESVQSKYNREYGVCIDINLITAALTVSNTFDEVLEDGSAVIGIDDDDDNSETPYKEMKRQVGLLAKMQIVSNHYSLDSNLKETTGSSCVVKDPESKQLEAVNSTTLEYFTEGNAKDSSSFELIAGNDTTNPFSFLMKRVSQEENNAYYLYRPYYNNDGTCTEENLDDDYELSIGTDENKEESAFYWNLVNSFIDEYYDDYLPNDETERREKILSIADDIYLLYQEIGPSQTCTTSYAGLSNLLCPNGVTIAGDDEESAVVIPLEEYIAGVVSNEAYTSEGMEALKAQAVAARTYALTYTANCTKAIPNNTNAQTFTRNINDRAREAAQATAGEVLTYNGELFSANYDSFCYDDEDCPDATRNSDGTYTVTYTKVPSGEKHIITLSDSSQYGRITHGQGHARGMSQLLSYQMAKEGRSYQEILSYFYSDGVQISLSLAPTVTEGSIITTDVTTVLANAGSSVEEINDYIYNQVIKAGLGTREGVVAAGTALVSGFNNKTGAKLPYELYPSGKYTGYGMDPLWGSPTGRTDYPVNGLDCSGFISWAIHNGGYEYVTKSARGWGDTGVKRAWSRGTTDSTAKPGDLIYNAPRSENGTTGHIQLIIGTTDSEYIVAEASSKKNGVRIKTISHESTGDYYLVDMSSYYQNATKVTDYPY